MMRMSAEGRAKLTEPWEECVLFSYDDKMPKRRNPATGRFEYPIWEGGALRGTATVGIGHTDAAGPPRVTPGMRITREQADEIFESDIRPCEDRINRLLKTTVTQHQYDALVDTQFNCPTAITRIMPYVNRGDWTTARRLLMQYVYSRGEYMAGLVHRRTAEIAWAETPDDPDEAAAFIISPKAERAPPPKSIAQSKVAAAATGIFGSAGAGLSAALDTFNEHAEKIKDVQENLTDLGVMAHFMKLAHSPAALVVVGAGLVMALAAFVAFDRWQKLQNEHV